MTKVRILYRKNCIEFSCVGHAGYDVPGKDIVCASISTVCYMLAAQCEKLYARQQLASEPAVTERDGAFYITITPAEHSIPETLRLIEIAVDTLEMLQTQYPKNILVEQAFDG